MGKGAFAYDRIAVLIYIPIGVSEVGAALDFCNDLDIRCDVESKVCEFESLKTNQAGVVIVKVASLAEIGRKRAGERKKNVVRDRWQDMLLCRVGGYMGVAHLEGTSKEVKRFGD